METPKRIFIDDLFGAPSPSESFLGRVDSLEQETNHARCWRRHEGYRVIARVLEPWLLGREWQAFRGTLDAKLCRGDV